MSEASVRAERAKQLLEDDLLVEALDRLERDAVEVAKQAKFEPNDCIAVVAYLQAAFSVREQLTSVVNSGKVEERKRLSVA